MKSFVSGFAAAAAVLSIVDMASATDLIAKARPAPQAKYDPCGTARFSGAYLGGNAGAIAYTALRTDRDNFLQGIHDYSANTIGATAGLQAGYDWQSCNKVFGVVADWNWADAKATAQIGPNVAGVDDVSIGGRMDWFSTIRARAGVAVNDTLFYVTGGAVAARIQSTINDFEGSHNASRDTRWGLVGGAGAELALGNNWSLNAEALYMQFQKSNDTFRTVLAPTRDVRFENNDSAWVSRVGLNYRWDNPRMAYAAANGRGAAPADPCGPSRFGGGYVGGNLGAASSTALRRDRDFYWFNSGGGEFSGTTTDVTAGAQIGWDWQSCNKLFGVVADWNWTNADTSVELAPNAGLGDFQSQKTNMDWFATIRARAGLVVDDTLVYVTGGVAAARIDTTVTKRIVDLNDDEQFTFGGTRWGLAGGFGAEFALGNNWSLNTELLYMQFRKKIDTFNSPSSGISSFESHDSAWINRAGLNYRWDNPRNALAAVKAPAAAPCGPSRFSGGYVGGNVGALRRTALSQDLDSYMDDPLQLTSTKGGAAAGGQIGFDWQSCRKVFGVVADWNWTNADTASSLSPSNTAGNDNSIRSNLDWFSTIRTRAGLAMNDTLVYVTGGLAAAKIETKLTNIVPTALRDEQTTISNTRWGWTGGAGAEFALAGNWSVNGEVLYMQFRKETDTFRSADQGNRLVSFVHQDSAWVGRVGLNYRWGAGNQGL